MGYMTNDAAKIAARYFPYNPEVLNVLLPDGGTGISKQILGRDLAKIIRENPSEFPGCMEDFDLDACLNGLDEDGLDEDGSDEDGSDESYLDYLDEDDFDEDDLDEQNPPTKTIPYCYTD